MLMHRLRGNRDDLTALHWSNLLVVEQGFSSAPPIHKIKRPVGRVYFMADGEGFEPPVELPPQRFSRPSQSTALPPILNFYTAGLSNLRFCSLSAPGGAAHHSFALDCADACLADSYARPSQSTALPPILNFLYRRSFKPVVLFAVRTHGVG